MKLSDEQTAVREMVRKFAQTEIEPRAAAIDRDDEFPWDVYAQLGDLGLLGLSAPEEHGGGGGDNLTHVIALEEVAKASGTAGNAMLLAKLQTDFLTRCATPEQASTYLPDMIAGRRICLICVTEPGAGSDVQGVRTTAVRDGDHFVLDGTKAFMTCGTVGDVAVVLARTDPTAGSRGMTTFLVEKSRDGDPRNGFVIDHKDDLMGLRGLGTAGIAFAGTRVPAANVLGVVGDGFKNVMKSFDNGRIYIATLALGLAQRAFEESVAYARDRRVRDAPIADFQGVQFMLSDMSVEIEAARLLIHRAAELKDAGADFTLAAAHAKLYASDVAQRVTTNAVQVHGGFGYTKEAVVERLYRDAKLTQIYEGTNQVQRVIIARHILKAS
ncbi:MAG: Alkylation response protein AidB-like acyl-CoA dehydrogenase [Aeromicrobium sp.]|jgi:alkylation response protein AidB-like acyl-CoA dehydrogenase|nr:Alkylation response protein AidB-like acyl-CoA dehydrogenase [Aeromicrobium sp.]